MPDIRTLAKHNEKAALIALEYFSGYYELEFPSLNEVDVNNGFQPISLEDIWKESLKATTTIQRMHRDIDPESHLRCGQVGHMQASSLIQTDELVQVHITPTARRLQGPLVDRANRVLRLYPRHHSHFIRVTFCEENFLSSRFAEDRSITHKAFVHEHYGSM